MSNFMTLQVVSMNHYLSLMFKSANPLLKIVLRCIPIGFYFQIAYEAGWRDACMCHGVTNNPEGLLQGEKPWFMFDKNERRNICDTETSVTAPISSSTPAPAPKTSPSLKPVTIPGSENTAGGLAGSLPPQEPPV